MPRALRRLVAIAGWALLGALALLGVSLSGLATWSASPPGRAALAERLARELDGVIAGRLTLEAVEVLPGSGFVVHGLRLDDPDGHPVLAVSRARISADLTRLVRREVRLTIELDAPSLLLDTGPDGDVSLTRALAPAHPPLAPASERHPAAAPARRSWTIDLERLTARAGVLRWRLQDGSTAVEVTGLELDAEGAVDAEGAFLGLRLRAAALAPLVGPLALDAAARLDGDRLEVPVLDVALGDTALELRGEADLRSLAFRAAVTRLGLAATDARRLAPAATLGADVAGTGYAESDGAIATAALEVPPAGGAAPAGRALVAVALRLAAPHPAVGFDVALAAFDPSSLLAQAPPGRLDLTARGAAAGRGLADGRGRLALAVAPSRLREGELGPITLRARAGGGRLELEELEARLPGLALSAGGSWCERSAVGGDLTVDGGDLARAGRNLAALAGVPLPPLDGRLRARATLAGTGVAPVVTAKLDAPLLKVGTTRVEAATLSLEAVGPVAAARVRLTGRAARAEVAGAEARLLQLAAALAGDAASLSLTGAVPSLGPDPVALEGAARLGRDRRGAELRELSIRWPGTRYVLARPAAVTFAPARVDRLELADGPRSVAVSGGLGPRGALDARLEVVRLDLAQLPRALFPPGAEVTGELSLDARATGAARTPTVAAQLRLTDAGVRGLTGLQVLGDVRWDGRGRLTAEAGLRRAAGGALDLAADLPLPLAGARAVAPIALTVEASGLPVEALRKAAGTSAPVTGTLGGRVALSGTAGAPRLDAALALEDAAVADLGPLAAAVALGGASAALRVTAAVRLAGAPLLALDARAPIDLAALLRRPEATLRALSRAPLTGSLEVPGVELARLAGKAGLPEGLAGTVSGGATLGGTAFAPRGRGTLSVAGGAAAGYRDIAARVEVTAEAERTAFAARASLGGADALRAEGALGAPVERLSDAAALRSAPLSLDATVPTLPLARAVGPVLPLAGTVSGRLAVKGTLARPEVRLDLAGKAVEVKGRPLGDLEAVVRHEPPTSTAEVSLRPSTGGSLSAHAELAAPLGLGDAQSLRQATATVRIDSDGLELGFLPALVPGVVRSASGRLTVDLAASGPLAGLRPRGTVKLEGGRLAVAALGEWADVEVAASLGERTIEVSRLDARKGAGRLSGQLAVRDLGTAVARLDGRLVLEALTVAHEGVDLATLDLPVEIEGTLSDQRLDTTVTLSAGTIRLPRKASSALQSLEDRSDIVEVDAVAEGARRDGIPAPRPAGAGAPFEARCRLLAPGKLVVRSEKPAVNLELKADSTWALVGTALTAEGTVEVVRGTVEPISGRVFHVERGRVTFPGGAPRAAQLDVVARYDNPVAVVTVTIGGAAVKPFIQLSSRPPMDDAEIAMLIATGRTEINVNTSGVGTLTPEEASAAVVGAAMGAAFSGLVADKLPVDQISLDSSRIRAGKYVTDKIFVGYAYRFDAKPEEGENVNEVKAEYQLTPRWHFELRYGDAPEGDASLIWSKDY